MVSPSNTNEINQLITDIKIPSSSKDKRICVFCNGIGDMTANGAGRYRFYLIIRFSYYFIRLLNLDVGQWCHLNCAFWSYEVYETLSGALMCVEQAFTRSINTECIVCKQHGSSLTCFYQRCPNTYHFTCAIDNGCVFYKDKVRY
jgi:histone-lysine N-methyltransferase MLL3